MAEQLTDRERAIVMQFTTALDAYEARLRIEPDSARRDAFSRAVTKYVTDAVAGINERASARDHSPSLPRGG